MNDEIQDDAELNEDEGPQERNVRDDDDAPGEWEDPATWRPKPAGGLAKTVAWVLLVLIVAGVVAGLALALGR